MNIHIFGKHGVSAVVLRDSISVDGIRLVSFEVTYPRLVLAENNTHRGLSKASASSRAIPFKKMAENLTGRPVRFGAANPGMQDTGVDFDGPIAGYHTPSGEQVGYSPDQWWESARDSALYFSEKMYEAGYAKQVYNRLTEPFQMMKTVISGTELENFFWLRDDGAADPSLAELARCMRLARDASTPELLQAGEWHLPYVDCFRHPATNEQVFYITLEDGYRYELSIEEAIKVSCARSAAVSFRNTDYGLEKCLEVYDRLVGDERKHASALEHQATPMVKLAPSYKEVMNGAIWAPGVSHMDRDGHLWSGNFRGFIQHRKTVPGENKSEY